MAEEIFEIRFEGGGINPSAVRASEVAELIASFEKSILSTLHEKYPDIDTKQYAYLSVYKIEDHSLGLKFLAQKATDAFLASYLFITTSISDNNYSLLPAPAIEELKILSNFSKRHNCDCNYLYQENQVAKFTPQTIVGIGEEYTLKGETIIYGKIQRVGGETPRIVFKDHSDNRIYFQVNEENAKKLAKKLYDDVALTGIATWDKRTYRIIDFKVSDIVDLNSKSLTETFSEIRTIIGKYWDEVDDIESVLG